MCSTIGNSEPEGPRGFTCCVNKWICNLTGSGGLPSRGECRKILFFSKANYLFRMKLDVNGPIYTTIIFQELAVIRWCDTFTCTTDVNFEKGWLTQFCSFIRVFSEWRSDTRLQFLIYSLIPLVWLCLVKWNKEPFTLGSSPFCCCPPYS